MSEKLNSKCPVCNGYLFDDDDIVYCPVCGAPHHRDCYNAVGHCGREDEHGKEPSLSDAEQASAEKQCKYCEKNIPNDTNFCPYCGKIQPPAGKEETDNEGFPDIKFVNFPLGGAGMPKPDPYGGLNKEDSIDGVKIKDLAKFIVFAPGKLLPKWKHFSDGTMKKSWNWMAFISPYTHTIFRKMGFHTLMYIILELAAFVLMAPFHYSLAYMDMPLKSTALQVVEKFSADPLKYTSVDAIVLALIGVLLFIGYRIFAGLRNDIMYKNHAISTIKKIRSDLDADEEYDFYRKGGVRPMISMIVFLIVFQFGSYIPLYIADFLFT